MLARWLQRLRPAPAPDTPIGFGYKTAWIAVPAGDPQAVARMLGLRDVRPSSWRAGVAGGGGAEQVFVTPALEGWILAVGSTLAPRCGPPRDEPCLALIRELSQHFGRAQYFATHRVVGLSAWARARDGQMERAYCFMGESGETAWDEGERVDGEPVIDHDAGPDEADVMAVAERWSVNPTTLEHLHLPASLGCLGRI
jgi:hypothetical protein